MQMLVLEDTIIKKHLLAAGASSMQILVLKGTISKIETFASSRSV